MDDHTKTGEACHKLSVTVNSWLSCGSNQVHPGGGEMVRGTFVIDIDVYVNPNSNLRLKLNRRRGNLKGELRIVGVLYHSGIQRFIQ